MTGAETKEPRPWNDWYRFAREALELEHDEAVEYANLRFIEEQNHATLDRRKVT